LPFLAAFAIKGYFCIIRDCSTLKYTKMHKENFVVDDSGKRIAVMLPLKTYMKMMAAMEELEDIKAYDAAKARNETSIPLRVAIKNRKQKQNG
jgi:hypothetical protein